MSDTRLLSGMWALAQEVTVLLETQAWKQGQASCEGNTTGGSVYSHLGNKNWWGGSTEREQRHVQISLKLDRKKKKKTKKLDRYATTEIYPFISLNSYSCVCILNIQAHLIYLCFAYTVFPTNGATGRSGTPSRQSRGVDPPVEIRRVEGAQTLASVFGIIAGLFGLLSALSVSKGKLGAAKVFGWLATILAVGGTVWGIIKGAFGGYAFFPATDPVPYVVGTNPEAVKYAEGTYHLAPMVALLCLAVLGVLFILIASAAKRAYMRSRQTVAGAAYTAAAPVAVPVAEPVVVAQPAAAPADVDNVAAAQAAAAAAMAAANPTVPVKTSADYAAEAKAAADEAQALAAAGDYEAAKVAARRAAAAADEAVKAANA